ncbi:MAG: penicillin-binding protein 1A, partial [Pseudomonadales bacterium]
VSEVGEKSIKVLLVDSEEISVEWDHGLAQARSQISPSELGDVPKQAADVVKTGDLVRVQQQKEHWQLVQIPAAEAALVSLDANNGAIRALVGGFDFQHSKFNRATQAKRQPGSSFKPFIYAAALKHGFTPASLINDAPVVFEDKELEKSWRPENASGKFYGPTRMRKALYLSRNLVSIRLLHSISPNKAVRYLQNFGFNAADMPKDLSLALGSHALTPLDIASGYAVFANGGYAVEPYFIERIVDNADTVLFEANPATVCIDCADDDERESEAHDLETVMASGSSQLDNKNSKQPVLAPRVIDDRIAYIVDSMLKDVIVRGTGTKARVLERPDLAGKTGTTNGPTDAWFSGYGGSLVTTVWLGFDQNQLLGKREYGGSAALPMWVDYMRTALEAEPVKERSTPNGLVTIRIDPETGLRAGPLQRDAIFEIFRSENIPEQLSYEEESNPYFSADETTNLDELF